MTTTDHPVPGLGATTVTPVPVVRSPSDVLRLTVAGIALAVSVVLIWLAGDAVAAFLAQLLVGLQNLPAWLVSTLVLAEELLSAVLIVGGLVFAVVHQRWRLLLTAGAGAVAAVALLGLLQPLFDPGAVRVTEVSDAVPVLARFPSAATLAAVVGVVTAAAPWVSRRWRRAWWTLVALIVPVHLLGVPVDFDTLAALLAGWFAGAAMVVIGGAPSRRPHPDDVAAGLASVGVALARLEPASVDARGSTPYFATGSDGTELFVKVLGADERSADLLFRLYRRIQPRDLGDERPFSSLRRTVEHEALVALVAGSLGIRTPRLAAFASAEPNGYVLAYEAIAGRSLDRLSGDEMTDDVVRGVWTEVANLRRHRLAHRDLRLANAFLADDGRVWLIDFGFSELAASDLLLATDVAELLASSSTQIGAERAVTLGREAVGPAALIASLERLHPPMLSGATRTALHASPGALEDLRARVSALGPATPA